MTKKDYELIAAVLSNLRGSPATSTIDSTVAMVTCDLADALAKANPKFDKLKFFQAAAPKPVALPKAA